MVMTEDSQMQAIKTSLGNVSFIQVRNYLLQNSLNLPKDNIR